MKRILTIFSSMVALASCMAQPLNKKINFTHQDTLRGSIGVERAWWDVLHYDIAVTPDYDAKTIVGRTDIRYKVLANRKSDYMQIDLQQPMMIDSIFVDNRLY